MIWLEANRKPENIAVHKVAVSDLLPYSKILNMDTYFSVVHSMERLGLMYPLIVVEMDADEWRAEEYQQGMLYPPSHAVGTVKRVQCGNNRYYALRDYFDDVTYVDCIVTGSLEEAQDMCKALRKDKTWHLNTPS